MAGAHLRGPIAIVAALLLATGGAGCIEAVEDLVGSQRALGDVYPAEAWDDWPGSDIAPRPPSQAQLAPVLAAYLTGTDARLEQLGPRSPHDATPQVARQENQKARRLIDEGLELAAVQHAFEGRYRTLTLRTGQELGTGPEEVRAYIEQVKPLDLRAGTAERFNATWSAANATGMPMALSLLPIWIENWTFSEHEFDTKELRETLNGSRSDRRSLLATILALQAQESLAKTILANATDVAGHPTRNTTTASLGPLFETIETAPDLWPRFDERANVSLPVRKVEISMRTAAMFHAWNWSHAGALQALDGIAHVETLHELTEEEPPTTARVTRALKTLSNASGPLEIVLAHRAWKAYLQARQDPNFMLLPIAYANVLPLAREVSEHLVTGDPVDWGTHLDPMVERWGATWAS